jgi:hypothetical protein
MIAHFVFALVGVVTFTTATPFVLPSCAASPEAMISRLVALICSA